MKMLAGEEEEELEFKKTPTVIGNFLRGWQMDVPVGHPLEADPQAFLESVCPQISQKLEEELRALHRLKFQLALKVNLKKTGNDGREEFTDPVFRHVQEAAAYRESL